MEDEVISLPINQSFPFAGNVATLKPRKVSFSISVRAPLKFILAKDNVSSSFTATETSAVMGASLTGFTVIVTVPLVEENPTGSISLKA